MLVRNLSLVLVGLSFAISPTFAQIQGTTRVADGLSAPIFATHAPGDTARLFIAQRGGSIRILDLTTGDLFPGNYLDSVPNINTGGEGGLLGVAFHPDYANNGKFYVNVTRTNNNAVFQNATANMSTHILEYVVSPTNPNDAIESPREILSFVQPQANHNGGWIGFSPNDGYLYIATGDGGGANDRDFDGDADGHTPNIGNAQDLYLEDDGTGQPARNLLGKILRIDVDGDDFPSESQRNYAIPGDNPFADNNTPLDDEIWSFGLRNPFRASFDRATGDLWIGDVGQGAREEIDLQPGDSIGGENYGWRYKEGDLNTGLITNPPPPNDLVDPIYDYSRGNGEFQGRTVTGGVVYRGPDPALRGMYIFGDYGSERNWLLDPSNPSDPDVFEINGDLTPDAGSIDLMVAYAEDADGNIYIVDIGGQVFRIDTAIQIPGDYNGNDVVDDADFDLWKANFGSTISLSADGNADGVVNLADYTLWRDNRGRQLPGAAAAGKQIPEPTTAALAGGTLLALCLGRVLAGRSAWRFGSTCGVQLADVTR